MTLLSLLVLKGQSRFTMMQALTVLIVHDDRSVSARISAKLHGRADVSIAATFNEAKAILATTPPAVLITGVRLGRYNGLHLVIRSRIDHPETASFVILEEPDAAVEQEAAAHGAVSLEYPAKEKELLMLVAAAFERVGR
jgi:DNA-binding NtrC family response regulator